MRATVSIVMPTFNRLEFLVPAVESVFAQSWGDWELILADDGSGQETRSYLESLHRDPRIRILWVDHCGNPATVRNAALSQVRGEYVAFLDSDDLWLPQKLERQATSLRAHPACRWGCTAFVLVDANGNPTLERGVRSPPTGWAYPQLLTAERGIHISSVLIATQLLAEVGGFDASTRWCCDLDMWFRLAARYELDGIDLPLTLGRRHAQHSCDDVTALEDHRFVVAKALHETLSPELRAVARRRRALVCAQLTARHGVEGATGKVLSTILGSIGHSWRYRRWWRAAVGALARSTCPRATAAALRWLRGVRAVVAPRRIR